MAQMLYIWPVFGCWALQMLVEICLINTLKRFFLGKNTQPAFQCKLKKNIFLLNFATNFLLFSGFWAKKLEKAYFDEPLEWVAPKCWLKYTTHKNCTSIFFSYFVLPLFSITLFWFFPIENFGETVWPIYSNFKKSPKFRQTTIPSNFQFQPFIMVL